MASLDSVQQGSIKNILKKESSNNSRTDLQNATNRKSVKFLDTVSTTKKLSEPPLNLPKNDQKLRLQE